MRVQGREEGVQARCIFYKKQKGKIVKTMSS